MISDAGEELKKFKEVKVEHVVREANSAAGWKAYLGHVAKMMSYWFESPYVSFSVIIRKDALG